MKSRAAGVAAILLGASLVGGWTLTNAANSAGTTTQLRAPFHATARCNDGTWSWNKEPAGPTACAAHGGVAAVVPG